jgi:DNA-binding GntR family transcriptional regulator
MTAAAEDDLIRALHVDRSSPVPLYFQLAQQLEEAINDGRLTPGTRIDTEVELARQLRLSRPTVRQAMDYLVDKGVIARRRGAGTRVVSADVRRPLELSSLHDDLLRSGQRPTTEVLSMAVEPVSGEVARALQIAENTPALSLVRLRSAMHRPIARLTNYLPIGFADLTTEELERRGLYDILRARGIRLHSANQVIGARTATAAEAKLLDERRNAAVLTMQRTTLDDHGAVVEFGTHIYAASRYRFEFSLLSP